MRSNEFSRFNITIKRTKKKKRILVKSYLQKHATYFEIVCTKKNSKV